MRFLSHESLHRLVDHFHSSRKPGTDYAFRRATGCAAARRKRRHVARRNGHIPCIPKIGICRIFFIFADVRLRIRRDIMRPGRPGSTGCLETETGRGRNGRQFLGRVRRHIHFCRIPQHRTALDAAVGMPDIFLHINGSADADPFGDGETARHAEKIGFILRFDGDIAVLGIVFPFAQIRIRRLLHVAHRDGARARKEILTAGRTDGDHFRLGIVVGIGRRAVVRIVCRDGKPLRLPFRRALFIPGRICRDRRMIHHDGERRPDRRIFGNAERPDADRRRAVIACRDGKRTRIERFVPGHVSLGGIVERIPGNREAARKFLRAGRRCRDGGQLALLFRRDGKAARFFILRRRPERDILRKAFRISLDDIHAKRRAHRVSAFPESQGEGTCVGIDGSAIFGLNGHGFIRQDIRILHVRFGRIVDEIQADLARDGVSFGRAATASCHICNRFRILRRDGQRFIDDFVFVVLLFRTDERQIRTVHVRFIRARDGIVLKATRDGVSFFFRRVRRDRPRSGDNQAVIAGIQAKSIGGNRRFARRHLRHMRPRCIGH